ncbi:A/G-specific adenine glycosylase [Marinicrinis sediminis]|uniref:Adenine DNA glycosylase n=1 Tax=Marinicrinis sediminis TaxID=1652465 RepID=A0ABW5RG37_9BACL
MTEQIERTYFVQQLLRWFIKHQRDLPWRQTKDPYKIWVSEIMLQQTRVDTVIPYYERFLDRFPTVQALAEAPEADVLKLWEGLGYYSRARNLQQAVREVQATYDGVVPSEPDAFSALKGVGPYTKGAVLSIAYNRPEPAVDGNVMRVLSRYFLIEEDIARPATRKKMEQLIREMIPHEDAGDFNQGLMELGALVCTPRSPSCLTCPVMEHCQARLEGKEEQLPVKKKAKAPRKEYRVAALIAAPIEEEQGGFSSFRYVMRQRPDTGLLAQMWELPHLETVREENPSEGLADRSDLKQLAEMIRQETGIAVKPVELLLETEHIFSHIHWYMNVYVFSPDSTGASQQMQANRYRWVSRPELEQLALPNVFVRVFQHLFAK